MQVFCSSPHTGKEGVSDMSCVSGGKLLLVVEVRFSGQGHSVQASVYEAASYTVSAFFLELLPSVAAG